MDHVEILHLPTEDKATRNIDQENVHRIEGIKQILEISEIAPSLVIIEIKNNE